MGVVTPYAPAVWVDTVTDADAAHMNALEQAMGTAVRKPTGTLDGEVPVWDATNGGWERSSVKHPQWTQADMAAGNKITTSTLAGGPPGAPADKDIWIATAVDAVGGRWVFQYNAGSASSFKWEFVGGSAVVGSGGNVSTASTAFVDITGAPTFLVPRAGDYEVEWGGYAVNGGTFASASTISTQTVGSTSGAGTPQQSAQMTATFGGGRAHHLERRTLVSGETLKLQVKTSSAANNLQINDVVLRVKPVRVS